MNSARSILPHLPNSKSQMSSDSNQTGPSWALKRRSFDHKKSPIKTMGKLVIEVDRRILRLGSDFGISPSMLVRGAQPKQEGRPWLPVALLGQTGGPG